MRIGIIGPTENEITPFISDIAGCQKEKYAMLEFNIGIYNSISVVAVFCGVCKVNAAIAAQILIDQYQVTHIIVTGVAGGIQSNLKILDTVISSEVGYHDVAAEILTEYHPWMENLYFSADKRMLTDIMLANHDDRTVSCGRIVTGESFINADGRESIIDVHNPLCVDMETTSIAHVCYVNKVPFLAIRSISDTPDESGDEVFRKHCETAAVKSVKVLEKYLDKLSASDRV